jgi:hypothetical protein
MWGLKEQTHSHRNRIIIGDICSFDFVPWSLFRGAIRAESKYTKTHYQFDAYVYSTMCHCKYAHHRKTLLIAQGMLLAGSLV